MSLLQFVQLTPEEFLKLENSKVCRELLTPQQKFENYVASQQKRGLRLRKYHFKVIDCNEEIAVFDGSGQEIGIWENSVIGERQARKICFELFEKADNKNGSFKWLSPNNWEYQNAEQLDEQHRRTLREFQIKKELERPDEDE